MAQSVRIIDSTRLRQLLAADPVHLLSGIGRGIEKESLRVDDRGRIVTTPHPRALGSSLTSKYITTDFSEALLEFHTPVFRDVSSMMQCLRDVHVFTAGRIGEEIMWGASMPCVLGGDESIPLAQYGSSNLATMKTAYRRGLGHRYGRAMQAIAGMHYNFSLPENFWPEWQAIAGDTQPLQNFISDRYMGAIRNCLRYHPLLVYLFGASPAVCRSFGADLPPLLETFDENTLYVPQGTSLRLSEIGYQNDAQSGLQVSYNDLQDYADNLDAAVATPYPPYDAIGICRDGVYQQLNTNVLQVENEFYGWGRPKRAARRGERVTHALRERGVQYIEIRSLDLNPFEPLGIAEQDVRLLDVYLLYCIVAESPLFAPAEEACLKCNHGQMVMAGRDPELRMRCVDTEPTFRDWAAALLDEMAPMADLLDRAESGDACQRAVAAARASVEDAATTPSARSLAQMRDQKQGFYHFAMGLSHQHAETLTAASMDAERAREFAEEASASHERQAAIEAADDLPFDEYLRQYYAQ